MTKFIKIFALLTVIFTTTPVLSATCNSDQYAVGDNCYSCPANASCDGINFNCDDGFYRNLAMCSACPPNSTCTSPTEFSCNPGTYLKDGQCNACPANATCAGGDAVPHCNTGYYRDSLSNCISCKGHICEGEILKCCGAGYYLHHYGQCLHCSTGYYCPTDKCVVGITCDNGFYKDSNGTCSQCDTGYYCPRNKISYNTQHKYCDIGYYRTGSTRTKCDDDIECVGTYPDNMICPDGLYLYDDGRCMPYPVNGCINDPDNCNDGCFSDGIKCQRCPIENSTCTSITEFTCMTGYYKNSGMCNKCPDFSDCPVGSTQISCLDGYYLNNNTCDTCGSANWCKNNERHSCPDYTGYNLSPALPDGHIVNKYNKYTYATITADSIDLCSIGLEVNTPEGTYSITYEKYDANNINAYINRSPRYWKTVNTGYYLSNSFINYDGIKYTGVSECTNAPNNAYYTAPGSPEGNDCPWVCDDGYYRDGNECKVCPDGMNCLGGTIVCPAGEYPDVNVCRTCTNKPAHSTYTGPGTPAGHDCAWECDDSYGRTMDETCELLCPTDIKLRADGGISINIYANRLSDPSLNILYQDVLCYVRMVPGKKVGTLNTEYKGVQYYFSN